MTSPLTPDRNLLLRRLSRQTRRLRQDLRRVSTETVLLAAMEGARPLTPAERRRAGLLRTETRRLELDLLRLRREYARLQDTTIHQDVHLRSAVRGSLPALFDVVRTQ